MKSLLIFKEEIEIFGNDMANNTNESKNEQLKVKSAHKKWWQNQHNVHFASLSRSVSFGRRRPGARQPHVGHTRREPELRTRAWRRDWPVVGDWTTRHPGRKPNVFHCSGLELHRVLQHTPDARSGSRAPFTWHALSHVEHHLLRVDTRRVLYIGLLLRYRWRSIIISCTPLQTLNLMSDCLTGQIQAQKWFNTLNETYLDVCKIDRVFLEKGDEFLKVLFCWEIVTTIRPNCLLQIMIKSVLHFSIKFTTYLMCISPVFLPREHHRGRPIFRQPWWPHRLGSSSAGTTLFASALCRDFSSCWGRISISSPPPCSPSRHSLCTRASHLRPRLHTLLSLSVDE